MPAERILRGLNGLLPGRPRRSGAVADAPAGFDARRDAVARRYEYRVLPGPPSPLRAGRVLHHPGPLDAGRLPPPRRCWWGSTTSAPSRPPAPSTSSSIARSSVCEWERRDDELVLVLEADAFLRHMVRVAVGTMLLVGRGAWEPARVAALLGGAPRGAAGPTAPAHPLTLVGVRYQ